MRVIFCQKLHKEAEGLSAPPMPGALGQRIYNEISAEAWQIWLNHQTMLINEYRLSLIDKNARGFLLNELEQFLFGQGSSTPPGFVRSN